MKKQLLALLLLALACTTNAQTLPVEISRTEFSIGKSIKIASTVLGETRDLNVYLPLSYAEDSLKTYPVIYLLDGSRDEDFIHIAGIVQFGSFSWINMLPESIVVGIGNVDRKWDFTYPSHNALDQEEFPTSGGSERFIKFIETELQPYIDSTFRTAEPKTLLGQSLGGLLATEILFKSPELFHNYVIVSPSLWWDDESLLTFEPADYASPKSIYVAVGKEGEVMERTAKALHDKLEARKHGDTRLYFEFLEERDHGDSLHEAAYHAFEKIFRSQSEER